VTPKRALSLVVSLILSVFLLAVLLRQVRAEDILSTLRGIYLPALAAYIAVSLFAAVLRAWRFRLLLSPDPPGWGPMLLVTLARNAFDDLLPARIGSLSYIYFLDGRLGYPFERAAQSFLVAFIYDFLTLGPFVAVAVLAAGRGVDFPAGLLLGLAAAFFVIVVLAAWKLVALLKAALNLAGGIARRTGRADRKAWLVIESKGKATIAALEDPQNGRTKMLVLGLSLLIRLGKYVAVLALLWALLAKQGYSLSDIGFGRLILVLTGAEMTSAFPIKGLADFGTWETAWALGFKWMGLGAGLAIVTGIGIHLITMVFETVLGLSALLVLTARKRRAKPLVSDDGPGSPRPGD
jgi:uncharacterized membrane protein YbhN (UPF0104 family)